MNPTTVCITTMLFEKKKREEEKNTPRDHRRQLAPPLGSTRGQPFLQVNLDFRGRAWASSHPGHLPELNASGNSLTS